MQRLCLALVFLAIICQPSLAGAANSQFEVENPKLAAAVIKTFETKLSEADKKVYFANEATKSSPQEPNEPAITVNSPTNSSWSDTDLAVEFYSSPYQISLFNENHVEDPERLWSQTKTIFGMGLGVAGVITLLPQGISKWTKSDESLPNKWLNNVSDGPVWDRDKASVNYIGHPYFGGVYYQLARKSGYRQWDSFLYTALMSTFYWEYGVESFAEIPSIQDLFVTPIGGWVAGEWMFQKEIEIRLRGGTVYNSEVLGDIALFFLDPVDGLGRGINSLLGSNILKAGTGYVSFNDRVSPEGIFIENAVQLNVSYPFDFGSSQGELVHLDKTRSNYQTSSDPVDTGVVGLSAGGGYANFDADRSLNNATFVSTSLGIYFSPGFSASLSYATASLDEKITDDSRWENYSLSGQYYFNTESDLRPFIAFGVGETLLSKDEAKKTFQTHIGAGLYYKLSPKWALQSDWRLYYTNRNGQIDNTFNSSIIYRFGRGEFR